MVQSNFRLALISIFAAVFFSTTGRADLSEGIVWYGVLEDGLEEAAISGKPILLTSAAPQCKAVSGIW